MLSSCLREVDSPSGQVSLFSLARWSRDQARLPSTKLLKERRLVQDKQYLRDTCPTHKLELNFYFEFLKWPFKSPSHGMFLPYKVTITFVCWELHRFDPKGHVVMAETSEKT